MSRWRVSSNSRTISVKLQANVADFKRQMADAAASSNKLSAAFDKDGQRINTTLGRMARSLDVNRQAWTDTGRALTVFGGIGVKLPDQDHELVP